jgi:predicted dehydrogenase
MHAEYTIRALKAGKHVLCEKPMAVTVAECEEMIAAAKAANRTLGVAYRLHYEPMNLAVMKMCKERVLGKIKTFRSANYQDVKAPNIRLSGALGGGPVGDLGVYCINAARYTTGEEPVEVFAFAHSPKDDPRFREVPETVSCTLRFPSGVLGQFECSFGSGHSQRYRVLCEKGYIEMDPAFPYTNLQLRAQTDKGEGAELTQYPMPPVNHFTAEFDGFSKCLIDGKKPPTPGEEGLADMRVVVAIAESIKSGMPVKISS